MSFPSGRLDIVLGPMFSGKTTHLLRELLVASELGLKVLYINHTFDKRGDVFSTHHPLLMSKNNTNIEFTSLESLKGVRKEEYDVIGIDEAQFFDKYLYEFCKTHCDTYKRHIIVSGLDGDSNREKFGHVLDLIPIADSVNKLKSYCLNCGPKKTKAVFTHRIDQFDTDKVKVGGKDKYQPLCRECYLLMNI